MDLQLNDKIAVITGATAGIGLEIARQLSQAVLHVIIGARDNGRARTAIGDLASQGLVAQSVSLDLDDQASITAAAKTIEAEHGKLDISSTMPASSIRPMGLPALPRWMPCVGSSIPTSSVRWR